MGTPFEQIMEVAKFQHGYFATHQVDVDNQLLHHHEKHGKFERVFRGIYRVTYFPTSEEENFIVAYLWSKLEGVLSHDTALSVHDLSNILPNKVHLTLPLSQHPLRRKAPPWLKVHFGNISQDDQIWHDIVPVTTPRRTLKDTAISGLDIEHLKMAVLDAIERGYVEKGFVWSLLQTLQQGCTS